MNEIKSREQWYERAATALATGSLEMMEREAKWRALVQEMERVLPNELITPRMIELRRQLGPDERTE